jgi:hypothetical protein
MLRWLEVGRLTTRVFSDVELERLRGFSDIGREELIRFFTLTTADVAFIDPGRGRGPVDRLGLAVQLCTLPWLGFVPDDVLAAPPVAVARIAEALGLAAQDLADYGLPTTGSGRRREPSICGWRHAT